MTVDAWIQHPTPRFLASDMFDSLRRWTGQELPGEEVPIDATLAALDAGGVGFALLSAWHGPRRSADLQRRGRRLGRRASRIASPAWRASIFTARWTPCASCAAACASSASRACASSPGCGSCRRPTRATTRCYAECVELGVPFCTQVGHTGPLRPSETGRPIPYIDQIAIDFPELVIVCGHIGYPWTEEMVAVARKHENVYIDTSAYTARALSARAGALPAERAAAGARCCSARTSR